MPPTPEAARVAELELDVERLTRELDELRERRLDAWLERVSREGSALQEFERSLSWRITAPLRMGRRVQNAVAVLGVRGTAREAARRIRRRIRRR